MVDFMILKGRYFLGKKIKINYNPKDLNSITNVYNLALASKIVLVKNKYNIFLIKTF